MTPITPVTHYYHPRRRTRCGTHDGARVHLGEALVEASRNRVRLVTPDRETSWHDTIEDARNAAHEWFGDHAPEGAVSEGTIEVETVR